MTRTSAPKELPLCGIEAENAMDDVEDSQTSEESIRGMTTHELWPRKNHPPCRV